MVHHHHLVAKNMNFSVSVWGGVKLMTDVKPIPAAPTTGSLIIKQTASFATRSLPEFLRAHLYKPRYDTIFS